MKKLGALEYALTCIPMAFLAIWITFIGAKEVGASLVILGSALALTYGCSAGIVLTALTNRGVDFGILFLSSLVSCLLTFDSVTWMNNTYYLFPEAVIVAWTALLVFTPMMLMAFFGIGLNALATAFKVGTPAHRTTIVFGLCVIALCIALPRTELEKDFILLGEFAVIAILIMGTMQIVTRNSNLSMIIETVLLTNLLGSVLLTLFWSLEIGNTFVAPLTPGSTWISIITLILSTLVAYVIVKISDKLTR